MRRGARSLMVVPFAALTLTLMSGCAMDQNPALPDDPDSGSTATPAPTTTTAPGSVDDTPHQDLREERIVPWKSVQTVDEHHLRVAFTAGNPRCFGTRALVREDDQQVLIATIEGTLPDAPEACSLIGRQATLLITLDAPLGERPVRPLSIEGAIPDD
jgi:hypothetical protein